MVVLKNDKELLLLRTLDGKPWAAIYVPHPTFRHSEAQHGIMNVTEWLVLSLTIEVKTTEITSLRSTQTILQEDTTDLFLCNSHT